MALQENNNSEKNNSSGVTKKFWNSTIASLHYLFDNFNTLPFIGALVVTNKYVEIAVVSVLMDYFNDSTKENQRIAAIVTNIQDGLSSLFVVIVSLISEAYTGYYTTITFCTAASIEGLMLLWTSASSTKPSTFRAVYGAIFFLALGTSGQKLLEKFYEYQLEEKIKDRHARSGSTENKKEQDFTDKVLIKSWLYAPFVLGYVITICFAFISIDIPYEQWFRLAALLMGGTYMLFLVGSVGYSREELPIESNLHKIYRIIKAALGKRHEKYPTSPSGYYWKDSKRDRSCEYREGVRLLPRVPHLFRWLDKAAILDAEDSTVSLELQEKNEKLCSVKEVRDVKSLVPMFYLCFAFFGYSLLLATESTFFISQASNMTSNIATNDNDISILVLIMGATSDVTRFICFLIGLAFRHFKKFSCIDNVCNKKAAIARIGFGMVCAIICSLMAWQVEVGRLKVSKQMLYEDGRNSTVALVPQFSTLGITNGLVEGGIGSLFHGHVAKSMWSFGDAYEELVIGSGKLMIIPLVLCIPNWFGDTLNSSRLDKFYLMLGILNAAFLLVFCYYSFRYAYKDVLPQDDPALEDENVDFVCQSSVEIESKNDNTDTD